MRFWQVRITDPATGKIYVPNADGRTGFTLVDFDAAVFTYSSLLPNQLVTQYGSTNMNAQMAELDLVTTAMHEPAGTATSYFKIWGVTIGEIANASHLNGANVVIWGGMAAGLPLSNPAQSGILVSGGIVNAIGNWTGTEMTLTLYLYANGLSPSASQTTGFPSTQATVPSASMIGSYTNLTFQWKAGQGLLTPLVTSLQIAYPGYQIQGTVSPNLIWSGAAVTGFYSSLSSFAGWLQERTQSMLSGFAPAYYGGYQGVQIVVYNNTITIYDGTVLPPPKQIQYQDLVGQVTWVGPWQAQATCVMRADIQVGDQVSMPLGPQTLTANIGPQGAGAPSTFLPGPPLPQSAAQQLKNGSTFAGGPYTAVAVRHVGNSRSPNALQWVTTIDFKVNPNSAGSSGSTSSGSATFPVLYQPSNTSQQFFYLPK